MEWRPQKNFMSQWPEDLRTSMPTMNNGSDYPGLGRSHQQLTFIAISPKDWDLCTIMIRLIAQPQAWGNISVDVWCRQSWQLNAALANLTIQDWISWVALHCSETVVQQLLNSVNGWHQKWRRDLRCGSKRDFSDRRKSSSRARGKEVMMMTPRRSPHGERRKRRRKEVSLMRGVEETPRGVADRTVGEGLPLGIAWPSWDVRGKHVFRIQLPGAVGP